MTRFLRLGLLALCASAAAPPLHAMECQRFAVSVLVDGVPAPEYEGRGRIYIEALKGKEFSIRLSNPTPERVAVALSVDGRNAVDAKRTTELRATKWVLAPGQTVDIPGWQISGQTARRFFFTETRSSYAKWLGDTSQVGTIEAVFFREKRREPLLIWKEAPVSESGTEEMQAPAGSKDSRREAGAAEPKSARPSKTRDADSYAATGIGEKTGFPVQWVDFEEDPTPVARIALRYEFRPELVRLGVLPRENELFARDRARGFEHDYAPNPYRHR